MLTALLRGVELCRGEVLVPCLSVHLYGAPRPAGTVGGKVRPLSGLKPRLAIVGGRIMGKKEEKQWRRVRSIGRGELAEWDRLIADPDLTHAIKAIRTEFGLPLVLKGKEVWFEDPSYQKWMGVDEDQDSPKALQRRKLVAEVDRLMDAHGIPRHLWGTLFAYVVLSRKGTYQTGGFPEYTWRVRNGQREPIAVLTPETDIHNSLVLESLSYWQARYRATPPKPKLIGKRKDWRPVWEWSKQHPSVSHREIASALGLNRVTVSRALEELDKEHAPEGG